MAKQFTAAELSGITGSSLVGAEGVMLCDVDDLKNATSSDVSFLANPRYEDMMRSSHAGLICIDKKTKLTEGKNYLVSDNPSACFQKIAELFYQDKLKNTSFQGIHPSAVIANDVKIGQNVTIGPCTTIDSGCLIGDNTVIHANVTIQANVTIGSYCIIYPQVVVREGCEIHNRVILQPGAIIGSCGFGYITNERGQHIKLNQIGIVIIEDDCEIGSNTTIDRARFKATKVKKGSKIDNLVQIAHNVEIGEHNIIVAQTGIAGSSKTGKYVVIGGQVGVTGHIEITDQVQIATRSGISKSITEKGSYRGSPAIPLSDYNRYKVKARNIAEYVKRIEQLEKKLSAMEEKMLS